MSPPQSNTFSYDSGVSTEYPVRFRFPVTWSSLSAPLDREGAQSFDVVVTETKVRESVAASGSGGQWEMVIPKMARPPARPAPVRLKQPEPVPAVIPNPPQSTLNWILMLLGAVLLGLIVLILLRATAHSPVSMLMTISRAIQC